ncbi:MAG: hypothetical protein V4618_07975 [Pseudomonadota bacterium]
MQKAAPREASNMVRSLLLLSALIALPTAAHAQEEDAEHRADRLRTIELNRRAQAVVGHRDQSNAKIRAQGRQAQDRYERERADWQRRVAACRAGDYDACGS